MEQDINTFFSTTSLIMFVLVLSRVGGMISTAPLFATFPIPFQIKAAFSVACAFIMFPFVMHSTSNFIMPYDLISLTLMVLKESIIGIIMGFTASLIFTSIQIGGELLATQMGLSVANVLDPVTNQQTQIVGQFYIFLASLIFIYVNGHHVLLSGVLDSYKVLPIGLDLEFTTHIAPQILISTSQMFSIAFAVIMPVYATLLLTDISLAFMSKMMPQMNVFMVSLPFKIALGLGLMTILLTNTAHYLIGLIQNLVNNVSLIFM